MSGEITFSGRVHAQMASTIGIGGKLIASFLHLTCSSLSSLLILLVIVTVVKGAPTNDFTSGGGEKEIATPQLRSLYWPFSWEELTHLETQKRTDSQPIRLCGRRLTDTLGELCRGIYVGFNRRSDPDMQDHPRMLDAPALKPLEYINLASAEGQPKSTISSLSTSPQRHIRLRRNIVEECCLKPCSVNEMLRYCGGT